MAPQVSPAQASEHAHHAALGRARDPRPSAPNNTFDSDRVFEEFQSVCQSAGRSAARSPATARSRRGYRGSCGACGARRSRRRRRTNSRDAVASDSPARQGSRAWPQVIDRLTRVSRTRGPVLGWWAWGPCASWPARSADRYTGPWDASTKTPVLVMGIRFDPNTAFANARSVARRFGNAVLLTQQGYGHGTYTDPSACVDQALGNYLVDLVAPARGTVCPSDRQPFDPDFGKPLPDIVGGGTSRSRDKARGLTPSRPESLRNPSRNTSSAPPPRSHVGEFLTAAYAASARRFRAGRSSYDGHASGARDARLSLRLAERA